MLFISNLSFVMNVSIPHYTLSGVIEPPYTFPCIFEDPPCIDGGGISVDMFKYISKVAGFTFDVEIAPRGYTDDADPSLENTTLAFIKDNVALTNLVSMSSTLERQKVISNIAILPIQDKVVFLTSPPPVYRDPLDLLIQPFGKYAWSALIICCISTFAVSYLKPRTLHLVKFRTHLLIVFLTVLNLFGGIYNSKLTMNLYNVPKPKYYFKDIGALAKGLVAGRFKLVLGTCDGLVYDIVVGNAAGMNPKIARMFQKASKTNPIMVEYSSSKIFELLSQPNPKIPYVFVTNVDKVRYYNRRFCMKAHTVEHKTVERHYLGYFFKKNPSMTPSLWWAEFLSSRHFMAYRRMLKINYAVLKSDNKPCARIQPKQNLDHKTRLAVRELQLSDLAGSFLLLSSIILMAAIVCAVEIATKLISQVYRQE